MSRIELIPKSFFALRTDVKQNGHYLTDYQILYPAGSVLIVENYFEGRQRFIKLFEKGIYLEMIALSPSRKIAAIIMNGEKGQILVFDMLTLKKLRVLNLPAESTTNRFETITFSHDDMYIMAITGEPDWNLLTYKWRKGKLSSSVRATYPNSTTPVVQVYCSPVDNKELFVIGPGLFRLLSQNETVWRQYGFQRAEALNITSAAYLSGSKIICGTSDAKLIYIENGELRGVFNALTARTLNIKDRDSMSSLKISSSLLINKGSDPRSEGEDIVVRALISFPKGFAYSCKLGLVHVFERESQTYRKKNVYKIADPNLEGLAALEFNIVVHLSINVSQDKLLATTKRSQLYTARLWGPDINVAPEIPFKLLGQPLHHGDILGLGFSILKPLFVTCGGLDHTVRLWNFETETVQLLKQYKEAVVSLDIHPSGNFLAMSFVTRVELCVILIKDFRCYRKLPTQECRIVTYGYLGSLLAITNLPNVEIHNSTMFTPPLILKGLIGKPTSLRWLLDDKEIVACTDKGEIIFWDTYSGQKLRDIVTPDIAYLNINISNDGKFTYAVGNDGLLREFAEVLLVRTIRFGTHNLETVNLPRSNLMLFLTENSSAVLTAKMPLTDPPEFSSSRYHLHKITQLKISYDDQCVVTVAMGGALIIWKLNFIEGRTVTIDKNFVYSTEVLINKNELAEKIGKIRGLSQKLYELEVEQLKEHRDTEAKFCEHIRDLHEHFTQMIEYLKEQIQQTENDQKLQLMNLKKEIEDLKEVQAKEKEDLVKNYTKKLSVEYDKVQNLMTIKDNTVRDFEERLAELEKSTVDETSALMKDYESKIAEVKDLFQQTLKEHGKTLEAQETLKQNMEDDVDREIVEMRAKYEGVLKEEKELNVRFKEEAMIMRRKYAEIIKKREEVRQNLENVQEELKKYQGIVQALDKDVSDLKMEIVERDKAVADKEGRITELKKKIQELDKFKFVLEMKTKELRKQIEPKDREIREKNEQISDMEIEVENLKKLNASLELQLAELKEKTLGTEKEVDSYKRKHRLGVNTLRQVKVDIYSLQQELSDYRKLKQGIKSLYHKYHDCDIAERDQFGESDLQRELLTQREYLEKTIIALNSTLSKRKKITDRSKILRDNVVLLEELNVIRKQYKEAAWAISKLENLVGMTKMKLSVSPSEAFNKIQQSLKKQDNIKVKYQKIIEEADKETTILNMKVIQMQEKLTNLMDQNL